MAAVETRVCETDGCSSEAKLQCPTCIKLGIQGSYFCSQECFKGSWATHKLLHKKAKDEKAKREVSSWTVEGDINTDPWAGYRYTGKLRPHYPLMPTRPVPSYIQRPDYADHPLGMSESEQALKGTSQIKLLSSEDIEGMRLVCRLAREVLDIAAGMIKPGVTTEEIDHAVHLACIARNCYPSPLNYYNFPKSCCTSVNEVICHGIPDRRPLQEGDIVNVDITLYRNGYHGDLNETFFVGDVDEGARKLVQTTYECLMQAIDAVKPGVRYRELGNIIQKHAQANGFSVVRSYCGHGIHKLFHTAPNVPHYAKNKAVGVMKAGHVFTIEPMICEGTFAPWCQKIRRRQWQPTSVLLPGKSRGRRSLVGCSPWGREESDMTERLHFCFSLSSIGEGNGNPLQCSCLENPRDGGAWWAAVCGVAQSRTRPKQLSSSSQKITRATSRTPALSSLIF